MFKQRHRARLQPGDISMMLLQLLVQPAHQPQPAPHPAHRPVRPAQLAHRPAVLVQPRHQRVQVQRQRQDKIIW